MSNFVRVVPNLTDKHNICMTCQEPLNSHANSSLQNAQVLLDKILFGCASFLRVPTKSGVTKTLLSLLLGLALFVTTDTTAEGALSATTANTIEGTAPYLTFDGGTTKVTNTDELLGIELSDGTSFTKLTNTSSISNPIELPVANQTLGDIKTLIPATLTSVNLSTLIAAPNNRWGDVDEDGQGAGGVSATGTLSVSLKDVNNATVGLTDTLSGCNSPYTLTLTSTSGTLSTQYGAPRSTTFITSNTTYYIKPKINAPYVCYAQPNLSYENTINVTVNPAHWDIGKGFKIQDVGNPSSNFPRTGFNGAYFDMTVVGTTAVNVIAANGATVNSTSGATNIKLKLTQQAANVVRVTLSGPSSGQKAGQSGPAGVNMPTEFNLYSDAGKTNKIYSFALRQWYIPKSGDGGGYPAVQSYCSGLSGSYRVPLRADYTNNPFADAVTYPPYDPVTGMNNGTNSSGGTYTRAINGGIFGEWGWTYASYYTTSDWERHTYWTSEAHGSTYHYFVNSNIGFVGLGVPSGPYDRAACVSP